MFLHNFFSVAFSGDELGLYLEVILYTKIWSLINDTVLHLDVPSENNPFYSFNNYSRKYLELALISEY